MKEKLNLMRKSTQEQIEKLSAGKWKLMIILSVMMTTPMPVYAAEGKWDAVIGFITPWISRLGGAIILIGAVEFGLGFKNDDPESKTKGMRTVIAGCIVVAVGLSSSIFLY